MRFSIAAVSLSLFLPQQWKGCCQRIAVNIVDAFSIIRLCSYSELRHPSSTLLLGSVLMQILSSPCPFESAAAAAAAGHVTALSVGSAAVESGLVSPPPGTMDILLARRKRAKKQEYRVHACCIISERTTVF